MALTGSQTATMTVPCSVDRIGNQYRCIITDANGNSVASDYGEMRLADNNWTFTYDANGMRTSRTNGVTTYGYIYNGDKLSKMSVPYHTMEFTYDANGNPFSLFYNNKTYYYVTNLQGDVVSIVNVSGTKVVNYTYDAWGKVLTITGPLALSIGHLNPLRYRGYIYDPETRLYYLQTRYYNPEMGRFLNADALASTGQGLIGNNMFAYCNNNPANYADPCGTCCHRPDFWKDCKDCVDKTLAEKWNDYFTMLYEAHKMQNEWQQQIDQLSLDCVGDSVEAIGDAYVLSNELEAQAQYDRDMQICAQWEDTFRSPVRTGNFVTMTIGNVSAYASYYAAASASSISFLGVLGVGITVGCAIWSTLCYYEIIAE